MSEQNPPTTPENPPSTPEGPELVDRRGTRRRWPLVTAGAVVVVAAVVVATVVRSGSAGAGGTGAAPTAPSITLTVGLTLEPTNLDIRTTSGVALDQVLIDNVYQPLVHQQSDGTLGPGLAASWKVSADALTYTFSLPTGAHFSNGDALTAADAAWSVQDLQTSKGAGSENLGVVSSIAAPDATTLVLTLSKPYPDLLWVLSGRAGLVLDRKATNDRKTTAVGSGPFLLDSWKQGDSITLRADPTYWGPSPAKVGTVVFRYLTDTTAAVNALNAGDLDVLAPVDALKTSSITRTDVSTIQGAATDKFVLAFNNAAAPLNDLRVRQAIRYAIDHQALVKARGGVDHLLGGPIPEGDPGYQNLTSLYPHDVTKAEQLLSDAGYPSGLTLTLTIPSFYGSTIPDLLTAQLAQAGITLTVKQVEFSAWLKDVYTNADYQLSVVDHAESHDFGAWADPTYYFRYDDAQVQSLYQQAQTATSQQQSENLLAQAARIVSQDAAADWLTNFRTVTAVAQKVRGFPTDHVNARLDVTGVSVGG